MSLSERNMSEGIFDEKHIREKVTSSPPSELDHGIVKDWAEEESAVKRKYVYFHSRNHEVVY
jgi:hypothetical protein